MEIDYSHFKITRGDDEVITIRVEDEFGNQIVLTDGEDTIYYTVKKDYHDAEKIIQKVITTFDYGEAVVEITPEDTKSLKYQKYLYDVQWVDGDGKIKTIIKPSYFEVMGEITDE